MWDTITASFPRLAVAQNIFCRRTKKYELRFFFFLFSDGLTHFSACSLYKQKLFRVKLTKLRHIWEVGYTHRGFSETVLFFTAGRERIADVISVVGPSYGPVESFRADGIERRRSMNASNFTMC